MPQKAPSAENQLHTMAQNTPECQFENLADRLKRMSLKETEDGEAIPAIMAMNLKELQEEKIDFGKAHMGKKFSEMTSEVKYIMWLSENYKHNRKPSHVKFLRFIQLWVDQQDIKNVSGGKMIPKAKAKSPPREVTVPIDLESDDEELWDQVPTGCHAEMMEMRDQMGQMEIILQEVLAHLKRTGQSPNA